MNKRGQVYLLAVLILAVIIYTLYNVENKVEQEKLEDNFEKLAQNYDIESSKIINSLINSNDDLFLGFSNFTFLFTSYSKSQNPDFGLIYAFNNENKIQVGNFLNKAILIDSDDIEGNGNEQIIDGCLEKTPATITFQGLTLTANLDITELENCKASLAYTPRIWVQIDGLWYPFEININKPQIMIISKQEAVQQRKVYIGGEGFVKEDTYRPPIIICRNIEDKKECQQYYPKCKWIGGEEGRCIEN